MPELFRPLTQTFMFPMAMVARTSGPPEQIAAAVRQAAFEIDPVVPVAEMQPYTTMIAGTLGRPRLLSFLLTIFAAAGLALGLIGVYGVVAYRVRQREREIGIRLALGAQPSSMAKTVVTQGVQHAIAGVALGLPAAFLLSRVMSSMVFGVTTHDPLTFTALPILIVAVTTLACYLPARRAARVDPVVAINKTKCIQVRDVREGVPVRTAPYAPYARAVRTANSPPPCPWPIGRRFRPAASRRR